MSKNDARPDMDSSGNPDDGAPSAVSILVVDDNAPVRQVVRTMLEEERFVVVEAEDGLRAIRLLQESYFDVVITDLVMPDCDGIELIRTIKARYSTTKILAISGVGSATLYLKTARMLGADGILEKPFSRVALLSALHHLLVPAPES